MKDSQLLEAGEEPEFKYIKVNNERFSTKMPPFRQFT